ncbi:MAG: hypothetical protein IJ935_10790 [Afipia sp.]|nr:hypothetical protein [Afipia sp.]
MSAADALPCVKIKDALLIVTAKQAAVVSNFRMMHSPKKSEFGSRAGNALAKIPSQNAAKGCYQQVTFPQQFEGVG